MKKIFSIFAALLFAGSMMADDAKVTLDFSNAGWGFPTDNTTSEETYTNGDYSITVNAPVGHKLQGSTALLIGKSGATITLPAMTFNVSKIVVKGNAGASGKVTFNIYVGDDAVSTQVTGSKENHDFAIDSDKQTKGTIYVIKVTNDNNCQISAVEFYEAVAGAPENPTFSVVAGVYENAQSVELACATTGADIYYTLDGTDPSASSTKYSAAIPVSETTTIKAVAIKNSISSDIVSARYKIISLTGEGTLENPYTVEDVIALESSRSDTAWVQGYILGALKSDGSAIDNTVNTNIALGATADAEVTNAVSVQLVNNTAPRTNLNVKDHADVIGKVVLVRGALETYLNKNGVKGTNNYKLVSTAIENAVVNEDKAVKQIQNGQVIIIRNGVRYNVIGQVIE